MSEVIDIKPERTVEIIRKEFMQLCADVGNMQYIVKCHESDILQKMQKMSDLNVEAAKLSEITKEQANAS